MTQPIGSFSGTSQYPPSIRGQNTSNRPVGMNSMQDGGYAPDPYGSGGQPMDAGYYPYAGSSYYGYTGNTTNPELNQVLNLDPLSYNLYSGFDGGSDGGGYMPFNADGTPNGPPPPPSYIGDSPAGFAANVIDPSMAMATATYAQTKNMLDDYDQAHPEGNGD
jgi:hypothetical protein